MGTNDPGETRLEQAILELRSTVAAATASQRELSDTLKDLRVEIASTYVRQDVLTPTLQAIKDDVKAHDDWITWAMRIVLALVIVAVVGVVLTQGGAK